MRRMTLSLVLTLGTLTLSLGTAHAQRPDFSGPQKEGMKKLAFWVGEWEGSGWSMHGPGTREEFTVHESVQSKLGGILLLVQGLGKQKDPATGKETVGHDALAVVTFDPKTGKYSFRHYTMQGMSGEAELVITEKNMQWGLKGEGQPFQLRFTIEVQGDTWHEIGKFSQDGQNWMQTMEMTLKRVGAGAQ